MALAAWSPALFAAGCLVDAAPGRAGPRSFPRAGCAVGADRDPRYSLSTARCNDAQRLVPLLRNDLERASRFLELVHLKLPQPLAAVFDVADQPRLREHVQVFGHRLPGDLSTGGELRDRHRAACAQHGDETQPGLIAEGREQRRGIA